MSTVFFFNDTATTEIYTLSLHDALPISAAGLEHLHHLVEVLAARVQLLALAVRRVLAVLADDQHAVDRQLRPAQRERLDRKSTRLNSSHANISYAVFCLKKKKKNISANH